MPTWTLKADRRRADRDRIADRLEILEESVRGLEVRLVDDDVFQGASDEGGLRDFAPVAELTHEDRRGLQIVAQQLVDEFGWLIDLGDRD